MVQDQVQCITLVMHDCREISFSGSDIVRFEACDLCKQIIITDGNIEEQIVVYDLLIIIAPNKQIADMLCGDNSISQIHIIGQSKTTVIYPYWTQTYMYPARNQNQRVMIGDDGSIHVWLESSTRWHDSIEPQERILQ